MAAENLDLLANLRIVAREVAAGKRKHRTILMVKRYLVAIADILEIYLNFQRDKRWDEREW